MKECILLLEHDMIGLITYKCLKFIDYLEVGRMKSAVKTFLILILIAVGTIFILISGFFIWNSYSSPVNEAGREYRRNVRSYNNTEIESIDDVYERLELLDSHYNSATFSKMQGGEKTEVSMSDIQILFGEPHQILEEVEIERTHTVYKYDYENLTLNFHEYFNAVEEFVVEDYTEVLYDSETLNQLFFKIISAHQSQYIKENDTYKQLPDENLSSLNIEETPTRHVYQNGWYDWYLNNHIYFDTGEGEYAPEEYLTLRLKENDDNKNKLYLMERLFKDIYLTNDTEEVIEKKTQKRYEFMDFYESDEREKNLVVENFSQEFGEIERLIYDFHTGMLEITWLIIEDESIQEITAEIILTDSNIPSNVNDLADLEVVNLTFDYIPYPDRTFRTNSFIHSQ